MASAPPTERAALMSEEEFLALPDDGTERDLSGGKLLVWGRHTTLRNRDYSQIEARVAQILGNWLDSRASREGAVASGEAGFRLRRDPVTLVGADVAYVSADVVSRTAED